MDKTTNFRELRQTTYVIGAAVLVVLLVMNVMTIFQFILVISLFNITVKLANIDDELRGLKWKQITRKKN